jgi:ribosomal protein L16 Arg81 hydroxylase
MSAFAPLKFSSDPGEPAAIELLLAPLTIPGFIDSYWEQRPLIVSRATPAWFADLLSLDDIDRVLSTIPVRGKDLRIAQEGMLLPTSSYCGDPDGNARIDLHRVLALFADGATLILNHVERFWAPLRSFVSGLELFFGGRVQANVYITPPGSRGFAAHYDTHEVFLLQIAGAKSWRVSASSALLPLSSQPYNGLTTEISETQQEFRLESSDTLYLPRGYIHEATTQTETSIHITVGVFAPLWVDLLSQLVTAATEVDSSLRRSLPLGSLLKPETNLELLLPKALEHLGDAEVLALAREAMLDRFTTTQLPLLRGQLNELASGKPISLDSLLERHRLYAFTLKVEESEVVLSFCGRSLRFPDYVKDHLEFVLTSSRFRVRDLPDELDDAGKLVLASRLVREGFLFRAS